MNLLAQQSCSLVLPTHARSRSSRLGASLVVRESPQAAVQSLQEHLALHPEDSVALTELGRVWRSLGLVSNAAECFVEAIEHDASSAVAYECMGALLADELQEPFEAEAALQQAVALDETRHTGWNELGKVQHALGRFDGARASLHRARTLAPLQGSYHLNLAVVLRGSGRFAAARGAFRRAARLGEAPDQSVRYFSFDRGAVCAGPPPSTAALQMPAGALVVPERWRPRLSAVHVTPVASVRECEWVVGQAERHAARSDGWNVAGHHDQYPTTDVVVAESRALRRWLNAKLRLAIWPALAAQFGVAPDELWLQDAFVVRYDAAGQNRLGTHTDDSELSFNLLLSDPGAFEGGGTSFAAADTTLRPPQGAMLSHFGRLRHAGEPVLEGSRYILAGFVRVRPLAAAWREVKTPLPPDEE